MNINEHKKEKEITTMREITVKEFVSAFEGQLVELSQEDEYGFGFSFEMSKAHMDYYEDDDELTFYVGNYNTNGTGSFSISNVEENIESIVEDDGAYTISFAHNISDIVVTRFKSMEELEQERKQKKRGNFAVVK